MTGQADALMGIFGFKRVKEKAMDKVSETRRALFEAAWLKVGGGPATRFPQGVYIGHDVHIAWLAFNAALDSVEIVTPTNEFLSESFAYGVEQMIDAIESTDLGLRIK